jgi:hypothetical protein
MDYILALFMLLCFSFFERLDRFNNQLAFKLITENENFKLALLVPPSNPKSNFIFKKFFKYHPINWTVFNELSKSHMNEDISLDLKKIKKIGILKNCFLALAVIS